ncbi:hypothetical protein HRG_013652 [Hirsutella rhossiliensis]
MPRPQIDLSTVQEEITGLHRDGSSINTIRTHLLEHHQLQVSRASLYRSIKDWDFFVKHVRSLQIPYGTELETRGLRSQSSVLKEFGLKRGSTAANPLKRSKSQENAPGPFLTARHRSLQLYKDMAGTISIPTYMRQQHHIISRDALYAEYRDFTPENVRERWGRTRYKRRDFSIHGPDWVWSIDGYDKLKNWGFEIYAGIDATSWNVAKQYLHVLNQRHAMPRILRSDHDCWYFGRSIHNTRIESWWHRLGSNRAGFWRLKGGSIILFDISQIVHTFEAGNLRSYIISLILLVNRIMPRRSHRIGFAYAPSFSMRIPRT